MCLPIAACVVMFGEASHTFGEDEELNIRVDISTLFSVPVDIRLLLSDSSTNEVRIPIGGVSASFIFPPNDDNICEDDQKITITIDASSLPQGCVVGDPGTTLITIRDNDGELCCVIIKISFNTFS